MARYSSYAELEAQAPAKYGRRATPAAFQAGLEQVAPPGRRPRSSVVQAYGAGVANKAQDWLREWTERMFG